jgi:hypothetical protein
MDVTVGLIFFNAKKVKQGKGFKAPYPQDGQFMSYIKKLHAAMVVAGVSDSDQVLLNNSYDAISLSVLISVHFE